MPDAVVRARAAALTSTDGSGRPDGHEFDKLHGDEEAAEQKPEVR